MSDAFNASVDNFVKDLTRRACQASEEVGAKKSKLMKIDHDHVLAALEGMGAGHLCEDVREVALQEEAADRANVRLLPNIPWHSSCTCLSAYEYHDYSAIVLIYIY